MEAPGPGRIDDYLPPSIQTLSSIPAPTHQSPTVPPIRVNAKAAGKLLTSHPTPVYPQDALLSHLWGTVVLELTVNRGGIPKRHTCALHSRWIVVTNRDRMFCGKRGIDPIW